MQRRVKILLVAGTAALAVAAALGVWFRLEEARASARQTVCVHNLKFLSTSLSRYAEEHGGRYPGRLADLWPQYIVNLEDLVCPEVRAACLRGHGVPHPFPENPDADTLERLSSYAYVPGHTVSDPPDTVIAYEKEDNHGGQGRSLLYLDGRGAWEPPQNWRNGPPNTTLPPGF